MEKSRVVFWVSLRQARGDMEQATRNGVWNSEEDLDLTFKSHMHMEIIRSLGARGGHLVSGVKGKI